MSAFSFFVFICLRSLQGAEEGNNLGVGLGSLLLLREFVRGRGVLVSGAADDSRGAKGKVSSLRSLS